METLWPTPITFHKIGQWTDKDPRYQVWEQLLQGWEGGDRGDMASFKRKGMNVCTLSLSHVLAKEKYITHFHGTRGIYANILAIT